MAFIQNGIRLMEILIVLHFTVIMKFAINIRWILLAEQESEDEERWNGGALIMQPMLLLHDGDGILMER